MHQTENNIKVRQGSGDMILNSTLDICLENESRLILCLTVEYFSMISSWIFFRLLELDLNQQRENNIRVRQVLLERY